MRLKRRDCLRLGAAAGAGAALSNAVGCSRIVNRLTAPKPPETIELPTIAAEPIARLLNRAGFGPTPGQVKKVAEIGIERYVTLLLNPDDDEDEILKLRLAGLEALQIHSSELMDLPQHEVLRQMQQAALLRSVYSRHQLRERMVDFWSNHFNIYARKGNGAYFQPTDQLRVIREHALGTFPDMLRASAHSPAMLMYLDNQVNRRKDAKGAGANENYARELMELHTLGVHGGYTQKDVQEVARCLTGWTVEDRFLHAKGTFRFDADRHDFGEKTVLGQHIPVVDRRKAEDGVKDGDRVLDILTAHPMTAKYISHKLCRYFFGEGELADKWTAPTAETYLKTNGDIKAMLRPILLSDDLKQGPPILKRPFDFSVSALRALNADTDGNKTLQEHLGHMGQPLYQWPMPDGYPDKTTAWTGSLLARWNFTVSLLSGGIPGTAVNLAGLRVEKSTPPRQAADTLLELTLAQKATAETVQPLRAKLHAHAERIVKQSAGKRSAPLECAALLLSGPEFQWR